MVNYISHGGSDNEVIDDLVEDKNEEEISGKGKDNSKKKVFWINIAFL